MQICQAETHCQPGRGQRSAGFLSFHLEQGLHLATQLVVGIVAREHLGKLSLAGAFEESCSSLERNDVRQVEDLLDLALASQRGSRSLRMQSATTD
jgi:hypothetical protein